MMRDGKHPSSEPLCILVRSLWLCLSLRTLPLLLISTFTAAKPVTAQAPTVPVRSAEAVAILQQVLEVSGGVASIAGVQDIVAAGTISVPLDSKNQGLWSLTASAKGPDRLKVESAFPTGKRSFIYSRGTTARKGSDGTLIPSVGEDSARVVSHFFPLVTLAAALQDNSYSITLTETVNDETSGKTLYHLRLKRPKPQSTGITQSEEPSTEVEYYIEASTASIVRVQHPHLDRGRMPTTTSRVAQETYSFSNYQREGNLLLPHQIAISVDKRPVSIITISGYQLNTGIAETEFSTR